MENTLWKVLVGIGGAALAAGGTLFGIQKYKDKKKNKCSTKSDESAINEEELFKAYPALKELKEREEKHYSEMAKIREQLDELHKQFDEEEDPYKKEMLALKMGSLALKLAP